MDDEGFISIQYLFSIFLILAISIGLLFFSHSVLQQSENMQKQNEVRLTVDKMADEINQVTSNGKGYSKTVNLPDDFNYKMIVYRNYVEIESENRMAKSRILDCNLINGNGVSVNAIEMHSGNTYLISKDNDLRIKRWYDG